ncbi:efflux RND transporter periplasmic adaptor subunit [Chitinophaga nivalis]|uniref:Efflux RND transporter periplasmic adaptor subunit n=1 Tax=Chitinophaga nivalis TaxID=2991709 RepID=A0ABT3ITJ6_9BACT|nr:efflux RND transporter periplasmic adaptor subunit [Chitinophaga nivalis]MCW3462998.1 efflux RND transporter periplasmic adaptor subunit [Chitinophaga nivalis]MCW3487312.1 efflux RND transporter periplasmic adaptor subunit [Chitinophaga nivalis]
MKPASNMITIFLSAIVLSGILQSCGASEAKDEHAHTAAAPPAAAVPEAFTLQKGEMNSSIQIPGELIAFQRVDLYAKVSSFVRKLYVDVGSEVSAGQLLVTMEAPELNAQLSGAESRLKSQEAIYLSSKATYNRLLETSKTPGTVSQNDLDIAFAKQKSDLAQLEAARASYREVGDTRNYLEIRAPFSGIISKRNVSAGAYVGPAGKGSDLPIFTLQEQKKLRLVVSVPEAYTSYLRSNSEVKFTAKSFPGETFKASVSRLSGALDERLRSQSIEMDVANNDKKLLPGMVAEVSIPLASGHTNAFVVPSKAVLNSTRGVYVIKVVSDKAIWLPVKTGRKMEDKTEVFGELQLNDILIKTANEEIRDSSVIKKVNLVEIK